MESWGRLGSERMDVPLRVLCRRPGPSSAWPGRDVSLPRAVLLRAWGGRGACTAIILLCQQKTAERGKGKLRFAWVSSEPAQINVRRGRRTDGALAAEAAAREGRQGSEVGPAGRPRQGRRLLALPGFLLPPGSLSLGSCLSFHLPLIPLEAGLTQEPPKQGPHQCHTPAGTPANRDHLGVCALHPTGHRPLG